MHKKLAPFAMLFVILATTASTCKKEQPADTGQAPSGDAPAEPAEQAPAEEGGNNQ